MKRFVLAIALACSACTPNQILESTPIIGNVCTAAEGTFIDEKVLYGAEMLYNIPAHAYLTARNNGKISPELRTQLQPKLVQLYALLKTVRAAKGTVNCDFNSMKTLHADIIKLLPARN